MKNLTKLNKKLDKASRQLDALAESMAKGKTAMLDSLLKFSRTMKEIALEKNNSEAVAKFEEKIRFLEDMKNGKI
jgi:phage gp36-like protein